MTNEDKTKTPDLAELTDLFQKHVEAMEESPEKRQARRSLKAITGGHHSSEQLTQILETKSERKDPILSEARKLVENNLQMALDYLHDVTSESQTGAVSYAKLTLLYFCVDELLAALNLTEHAFANQAYAHLRSVQEALDKAKLFELHPEMVTLWASNSPSDKKKQLRELSPASVREKLGMDRFDPIYSFLSEMGPHGSFRMAKTRSGIEIAQEGRRKLHIWIGGCPFESNIVFSATFLVWISEQYAIEVARLFREKLNTQEITNRLQKTTTDCNNLLKQHLIPWAEKEGLDTAPLIDFIEGYPYPWLEKGWDIAAM